MGEKNLFRFPFDGEGQRRMFKGSVEPGHSTRRIAAISLWDSEGIGRGTMSLPIRSLEGVERMKDISGSVLWVEIVYADETSAPDEVLGISSIEKAVYTPEGIVPDYFG